MTQLLYPTSVNAVSKQLNANYTNGDAIITLTNTTNIQNKPGMCVINRVDTNGTLQATSGWTFIEFTGTSGATLTGCSVISGGQDQALGKVVEFVSDVTAQQRILDALGNLVVVSTGAVDTTKVVTPTSASFTTNDVNLASGLNIKVNSVDPYRTITLTPGFLKPTTTAGCASVATVETSTNKVNYDVIDFDQTTEEHAWCKFTTPASYDGGVIQFRVIWTAASGSGGVTFGLAGRSFGDDDALDQALGTEVTVDDTLIATGDEHATAWSGNVTLTGAGAGESWYLELARKVGNTNDTLNADCRVMGIQIRYKQGQFSD